MPNSSAVGEVGFTRGATVLAAGYAGTRTDIDTLRLNGRHSRSGDSPIEKTLVAPPLRRRSGCRRIRRRIGSDSSARRQHSSTRRREH